MTGFRNYTPGPAEAGALILWMIAGSVLGSAAASVLTRIFGYGFFKYSMLVSYPIMFIPPAMYAWYRSSRNVGVEPGYKLDNRHFGKAGLWGCALMAVVATFAAGFMCDAVNSRMPEMPPRLKTMLEGMTANGSFWVNFVCVSILAPICEEWLCRGMILRGLLNYRRKDDSRGMKPGWAIFLSALIFGLIHLNPWQALPAIVLGVLFGYVYWRTGSLKLTMLMHCFNNTLALIVSRIDALAEAEYWTDILGNQTYMVCFANLTLVLVLIILAFKRIPINGERSNCDTVSIGDID